MRRPRPTVADLLASSLRRIVRRYDAAAHKRVWTWARPNEEIEDARRILKFYAGMKRSAKGGAS